MRGDQALINAPDPKREFLNNLLISRVSKEECLAAAENLLAQ